MNDWAFIEWDLLSPDDHFILLTFPTGVALTDPKTLERVNAELCGESNLSFCKQHK
jgi:hypothetical protein